MKTIELTTLEEMLTQISIIRHLYPNISEEKYKSYFNEFFKDGGKYLKFISLTNNNIEVLEGSDRLKVGIIVTIQKDNLRKELEAANIIKALNNGF